MSSRASFTSKSTGYFLLHFGHSNDWFRTIVMKWYIRIRPEMKNSFFRFDDTLLKPQYVIISTIFDEEILSFQMIAFNNSFSKI